MRATYLQDDAKKNKKLVTVSEKDATKLLPVTSPNAVVTLRVHSKLTVKTSLNISPLVATLPCEIFGTCLIVANSPFFALLLYNVQ